jgi:hypothetical protein
MGSGSKATRRASPVVLDHRLPATANVIVATTMSDPIKYRPVTRRQTMHNSFAAKKDGKCGRQYIAIGTNGYRAADGRGAAFSRAIFSLISRFIPCRVEQQVSGAGRHEIRTRRLNAHIPDVVEDLEGVNATIRISEARTHTDRHLMVTANEVPTAKWGRHSSVRDSA